ncbi:MAG: hypothetical protein U5Q44_15560 [Dehalococcoidia bacterium]|nr:hypothetical protein [Dehalococcoidia bacterium]
MAAAEKRMAELEHEMGQTVVRRRQLLTELKAYGQRYDELLGTVDEARRRLEAAARRVRGRSPPP